MRSNILFRIMVIGLLLGILFASSERAEAVPTAEFRYQETALASGNWLYDYTLFNTSGPTTGNDIYDVLMSGFGPDAAISILSLPAGWYGFSSNETGGFLSAYSTAPGASPVGTDIAPETWLSGFSFEMDRRSGNLPFKVNFTNADGTELTFTGTSQAYAQTPVPPSIILLVPGLIAVFGMRRRFARFA